MNIQYMIDISTAHIPEHTAKALEEKSITELVYESWSESWSDYGWIIWVGEDYADEEHKELNNILEYCQEHGIDYLKLDCDADTVEEFPTFEW